MSTNVTAEHGIENNTLAKYKVDTVHSSRWQVVVFDSRTKLSANVGNQLVYCPAK